MLVFSMGIVLIVGIIVMTTLIWQKISAEATATQLAAQLAMQPSPAPAPAVVEAAPVTSCPGGQVSLKGRGVMLDSSIDGNIMRVNLARKNGITETVMIDMCAGKILGSLTVEIDTESLD